MDITPLVGTDRKIIQSYGPNIFKVSGQTFEHTGIIVFPDRVESWAFKGSVEALSESDLKILLDAAAEIDVVLLGCGEKMQFVPPATKQLLKEKNVGLEPMDTGAACRTYNVLLAEGRRVVAALMPV